jgi:hypothetical protein
MIARVVGNGMNTYPDVTVICEMPRFDDDQNDTLLNPNVLSEVLSPTIADYDRGGKFKHYRSLSSLHEYVLISQDQPLVEHFVREGDRWVLTEMDSLDVTLALTSLGCELPLAEIYLKVRFDVQTQSESFHSGFEFRYSSFAPPSDVDIRYLSCLPPNRITCLDRRLPVTDSPMILPLV